mmetsp:Transcript_6655/g.5765  ORF Transcript_6655/g.5765 Transcript_6655/m.5765 type:complete len:133 (+) Transcript_6655:33-431(+)
MGNVNGKKSKARKKSKAKISNRHYKQYKGKIDNNISVEDTPNLTFDHENMDVLQTKRTDYYSKLGIEDNNRVTISRSNSLNRSLPNFNFSLATEKINNYEMSETLPSKPTRTGSTERLLKLNFLLKKKSEEN